jgi:hypothetical protein
MVITTMTENYFRKIINIPIHLPKIEDEDLKFILKKLRGYRKI